MSNLTQIVFLSAERGAHTLSDLDLPAQGTQSYVGNVLDFSVDQKALTLKTLKDAIQLYGGHNFRLVRIRLVLLRGGTYWDYPFTMRDTIVFSEVFLLKSQPEIVKTFVHEMVHLDQRQSPEKYENYYRTLGFHKIHTSFGPLQRFLLRNPDGDQYQWMFQYDEGTHTRRWVPLGLRLDGQIHTALLDADTRQLYPVQSVKRYYERFGVRRQLYHPNEIVAHQIADYLTGSEKYLQVDYGELDALLSGR